MSISASDFRYITDNMPINAMVCDAKSFKITYANKRCVDTLNEISHLLPQGVHGSNIIGQCIDVFHKNPQHQRSLLADPKNLPYQTVIRLGDQYLDLYVSAMPGNKAYLLTWSVVTEIQRLRRMADVMPINIMMCDPKTFDINYVNQTSLNTLKTIEHLLPVKANEVLGSNIDIFHKHPPHQRKMLSDPSNFPHKAKIKIGDEYLELNVAAIQDEKGHYIAAMVSWNVITTQVHVSEQVQAIANTVAAASTELMQTSDTMANVVTNASSYANTAMNASESTSHNVQTVASASEEMNSSINEISEQVSRSLGRVNETVGKVDEADKHAHALEAASESIGNIVQLIQDIASQINLLALNATIESARAGEAGKGFAVVASEVKNLATQTANATQDIISEIEGVQNASKQVVQVLNLIKESVTSVSEYSSNVAAAVEEQSAATAEIASSMQTASSSVAEVNTTIQNIAQETANAQDSTKQVKEAAEQLSEQAEMLNNEIKRLLDV